MKNPSNSKPNPLKELLAHARAHNRTAFLDLYPRIALPPAAQADDDQLWLLAEAAYLRDDFPMAIRLFELFEKRASTRSAPAWQRYLSSHRRCFANLQTGKYDRAALLLEEAEARLAEDASLKLRGPDIEAMKGHFSEYRGDHESALACFERAYEAAMELRNWHRAATAASDVGRTYGILGRPADGLRWLNRARERLTPRTEKRVLSTIDLREAMLLAAMERFREAITMYGDVIRAFESRAPMEGSSSVIPAHIQRAELLVELGRYKQAEEGLLTAIRLASQQGMVRDLMYAHKNAAHLYLRWGRPGDDLIAQEFFAKALAGAMDQSPPPLLILSQLADDILVQPGLVSARPLPRDYVREMTSTVARLKELNRPWMYQQSNRLVERRKITRQLLNLLERVRDQEIVLAHCVVRPVSGTVRIGPEIRRISTAQLEVLEVLVSSRNPLTTMEVAEALDVDHAAATKRVMRLREAIGADLVVHRKGATRIYSLATVVTARGVADQKRGHGKLP